jgi:hypothetical protein
MVSETNGSRHEVFKSTARKIRRERMTPPPQKKKDRDRERERDKHLGRQITK